MLINDLLGFFSRLEEPIFILNKETIEFVNYPANEFFKLGNTQVMGENFLSILLPFFNSKLNFINIFKQKINSSNDSELFEISDLGFINKTDKLSVSINKIDNTYTLVHFLTNSLEIKNLNKNFEREKLILNEKLKKSMNVANEMKAVFLNQVSHEIRTPLSAMLSFASLIKEELQEHIPSDLETGFEVIKRGGDRVIRTVDLMLNMSEVLTNTFKFHPQKLNLFEDVFYNIFEKYKHMAKDKKLNFTYEIHSNNNNVFADEFMLVQIVDNLMNNALKFTNSGEVKILFYSHPNGNLIMEISDTGIGISEEFIKNLYQPFSQEEQGVLRKYEGNGLGLSLTKKYCEINKIDLRVESLKNVGTTVYLEFEKNFIDSSIKKTSAVAN